MSLDYTLLAVDGTGRVLARTGDVDRVRPVASVGKLLLLGHVATLLDRGALDPAEQLARESTEFVADSGLWQHLDAPSLSVLDCCRLVAAVSDNLATNVLFTRVGVDAVRAYTDALGVAPYELLDLIGQGGMGRVWRARDTRYDRVVALKVIADQEADEADYLKLFRREADLVGRMNSPHIVPIHNYGEIDDQAYLDMRYVDGHSLSGVVRQFGPASLGTAIEILEQAASALDDAHAAGVVHRLLSDADFLHECVDGDLDPHEEVEGRLKDIEEEQRAERETTTSGAGSDDSDGSPESPDSPAADAPSTNKNTPAPAPDTADTAPETAAPSPADTPHPTAAPGAPPPPPDGTAAPETPAAEVQQ